jgi:pimeloyl-ACP methyl ester carboxylesterase
MAYADVNGIRIAYDVIGEGRAGTPLVMTHGFAGPSRQWRPEIEVFAEKRPLVLYDVRGHDRTTVPADPQAYSLPTFAADLAGLLDAIGIEKAHIGGVSMGGMITGQFAVDYPGRCASVMLCDTTCGNTEGDAPASKWEARLRDGMGILTHMVSQYGLEETVRREQQWKEQNDTHLAESPYTFEDDFTRIAMMTVAGYVNTGRALATRPDLSERITSITAPTLVMAGGWDDFLPCAERDHVLIPGSRFVLRERCGHGSKWRAETFVSEIEAFVADVEAGRPAGGERSV